VPLSRDRVIATAVDLADDAGLDATSMRRLADALGVTPMALYKHVADRERLIDGMVDLIVTEITPAPAGGTWRERLRARILSARAVIERHAWARGAIETRTTASPIVLTYMDGLIGILRDGGFSLDLVHNGMHALSTRMWGFTREVFPTPQLPADPEGQAAMLAEYSRAFPNIVAMAGAVEHSGGCDDQAEFEFALDLMLDGFERAQAAERVR
jgi:AcrR family transcriptional regulator